MQVGHEHLDGYFDIISRNLKPAGKAVIQVITRKDEGYAEYTHSSDFIRAHIFPGGHLPCMAAMIDCAGRATVPMVVDDCKDIGLDYAVTLHEWRDRWNAQHPELLALGYDDVFIRKVR
jgi:cyclopropane fatty-acyl-phospholipid synthase-like methyltransferase